MDNYESMEYAHQILAACEQLRTDSAGAVKSIETSLTLQESNVTEPGEREATLALPLIAGYGYHKGAWKKRKARQWTRLLEKTAQPVG